MSSTKPSNYRIGQSKKEVKESEKQFVWSVWIEAKEEDLKEIKSVVYILHPTFRNRVRTTESLKNKFKLTSKGWGEFRIFIRIYFKNESTKPMYLSHYLVLFSDDDRDSKKRIFVSSQIKDKETTEELVRKLKQRNFEVETLEDIVPNENISSSLEESIGDSDTIIVVGSVLSRFQEHELTQAKESNKNIYILSDTINTDFNFIQHVKSTDELLESLTTKEQT